MMDPKDRTRCYHCGAAGVPLVEWQPDPPRPDIPGPFPMVCANGCGVPALRIELGGNQTITGVTPAPGGAWVTIEDRGERPPLVTTWDLDTEAGRCLAEGEIGDRVKWKPAPELGLRLERQIDALIAELIGLTAEQRRAFVERFAGAAREAGVSPEQAEASLRELARMVAFR